jgi:hypothetical protein
MRSRPTGEMVRDDLAVGKSPGARPVTDRLDDARRVALAVNRAAQFGLFRPRCLVKSRALRQLLDSAGIAGAEVRVGVQLSHGQFLAHAWVEYAGQIVGDDPVQVAKFTMLPGINIAELE